jgi:crotonobetainyl-CoA:carnitine CoA-transferase CaiB-like acyl-CoA transferase
MEINAGKLSVSLNLKSERGKELLRRLLLEADMVVEGFSPGTFRKMGFGYEYLKSINPGIIYVQQSGMGEHGTYGRLRSFGPSAQAFSGLSEMSGLPEPWAPAGIGYSYLDWFGAYNMATAMIAALYRRDRTGLGCWIDCSQVEAGFWLTGTAVLNSSANGRRWVRTGNRSYDLPAAPHGVYRCRGYERWIAISAFTEEHWRGLVATLGRQLWATDPLLCSLALRLQNQDRLDELLSQAVAGWDAFELMVALQTAGVPAGVCQTAEDRCDHDPQLKELVWQYDLKQTELGSWPVRGVPVKLSRTPSWVGGLLDRHGPNYGEDTDDVLTRLLGLNEQDLVALRAEGCI